MFKKIQYNQKNILKKTKFKFCVQLKIIFMWISVFDTIKTARHTTIAMNRNIKLDILYRNAQG